MRTPVRCIAAAVTATLIFCAGACASTKSEKGMTAAEVMGALAQHKGDVATPSRNSNVQIPDNWGNGLRLVSNTVERQALNLPQGIGKPIKTDDNIVVYLQSHSGGAVIPTKDGVQLLTVIKDADAPEDYNYSVQGGRFALAGGGEAIVFDDKNEMQYIISKPWAKDAKGKVVRTSFSIDPNGFVLTQHIQHAGTTYPVVADPRWIERQWWGTVIHFTRSETKRAASDWQLVAAGLGWNWVAAGIAGALSWWFGQVYDRGNCIASIMNTGIVWEEHC